MAQDPLEKAFLAELEALEKFRISYTGLYPAAPLAREDPDIRRLIEAMAMFTARTRIAAQRNVGQSMLRMFRQHFSYLLNPVPAMTMLRAETTARYVDVTALPRGLQVNLLHRPGKDARDQSFRFQTLAPLRILPISLDGLDIFRTKARGYRILLRFSAQFRRNDEIGEISIYVNQLNDLLSSLAVFYQLKEHLRGSSVVFEKDVREDSPSQPCAVRFGAPSSEPFEAESFEHPLQQARAFLRFPQRELFINVRDIKPPRNWQHFAVSLDMADSWPSDLRLTAEGFQLHVVPVANILKDSADPIECDGTRERHDLSHPDRTQGYVIHSLLGVYSMSKEGLEPLESAVVGTTRESYEYFVEGANEDRRAWLTLKLPKAFDEPERVVVDALWHQPALRALRATDLGARLADRFVDGIQWSCYGPMVAHGESELAEDRDGLLQLLSIKNQRFLGTEDLVFLLRALGAHKERHFSKLVSAIGVVKVSSKPFARRSSGFKYVYEITLDDLDSSDLARLDLFSRMLLAILTAWSVEEVVELLVAVPNLDKSVQYT